ncbi:MAG: ABC transporter permease subunit [Caldilineae bacterium]|nr:MAG: ABC transporter permease subunit [Caldilineae bacterium]
MSQSVLTGTGVRVEPPKKSLYVRLQKYLGLDWGPAYVFVLPTILLLGGLIAYPFLRAVYLSFTNTITLQTGPFVGLRNYENLWKDQFFRSAVKNTIIYTTSAVFFKFWFGLVAAQLIVRQKRFSNILTGAILLPWIVPTIVYTITWRGLLDPVYGGVNQLLLQMGVIEKGFPWFGSTTTAMPSVIMVNIWQGIPFFTIIMLAGLKAIDQELYEAAIIDGASAWRTFLHITLPGLRYVIIVSTLLSTIWTYNGFEQIFLLTGGGPLRATTVYSILSWEYGILGLRIGAGVAVAMTMAPVLGVFIFILGRYMSAGGRSDVVQPVDVKVSVWSQIWGVVSWPVRALIRGILSVFSFVNDHVELFFEAIGRALGRIFIGGNQNRALGVIHTRRRLEIGFRYFVLVLLLLFELIPFYWVFVTAFKTTAQWVSFESVFWPKPWSLEQFQTLLGPTRSFGLWYKNTVIVALVSTAISVTVASLGAYGLTRLRWKGSNFFASVVLVAYLMPSVLMFIPLYQIFTFLHLTNSLGGLMVAYPTFGLPFALWLLMGYYASIPRELEEAALIDGCNHFQAWWRVVLPLAAPALLATALFAVTAAWKEFIFAFVFLSKERLFTLSVGLAQMIIGDVLPWGELMAASLLMAIPVIFVYILGQRFMVAGLTAGAVKG